jgi:hypothetical protein
VQVSDTEAVGELRVRQREAGGLAPGDLAPLLLPLLLSPILPSLSPHSYPGTTCPPGASECRSFVVGLVLADVTTLPRLTEFQTPTIFDHNRNFNRNTFYRLHKIVKIIDCTLYIIEMYL